jgi:pimeloyl-ACP methyl ester carboxylesterase
MKSIVNIIAIVALLYLAIVVAMYLLQRSMIFFPTPHLSHPYTERSIEVDTNTSIRVIEVNPGKPQAIIYFGGNAEAVAGTAAELSAALPDTTLFMVNYRGYGGSDGHPTEAHLFNDAEILFDIIKADYETVSVIGRSLGSGVACWLASRRPVAKVALITPFNSILHVAQSAYPILPVRWLLKDRFESVKYAPLIDAPVLVLIAEHDRVIPRESTELLLPSFTGELTSKVLAGTGHNDLQLHADYYPTIHSFFTQTP